MAPTDECTDHSATAQSGKNDDADMHSTTEQPRAKKAIEAHPSVRRVQIFWNYYTAGVFVVAAVAVLVSYYRHLQALDQERDMHRLLSHPTFSKRELQEMKRDRMSGTTSIIFNDAAKVNLAMSLSSEGKISRSEFYEGRFYCIQSNKTTQGALKSDVLRTSPTMIFAALFGNGDEGVHDGLCGYYRDSAFDPSLLHQVEQEMLLVARLHHEPLVTKIWAHVWGANSSEHVTIMKSLLPTDPSHSFLLHHLPVVSVNQ